MGFEKGTSFGNSPFLGIKSLKFSSKVIGNADSDKQERVAATSQAVPADVDIDMREVYFLILQLLSTGPCQRTFELLWDEGLEHHLLPRRYHAWYSRSGAHSTDVGDNGVSCPLTYNKLVDRYPHIQKDHLIKLLKQLTLNTARSLQGSGRGNPPTAADVPTILGMNSFSLLKCDLDKANTEVKLPQSYLRWPHMQAGQLHGLALREIGGGFTKHHRSPSIRSACYVIAKPLTMVEKMQNIKKLRGHRDAVYCAILDHSGRYLITGSDDRLVKIWSMETAFCLASCRGHEGDITDLAVSSNNALVASASNDFNIRVWRLADGFPLSVLRGHTGAVTAIAFSPRPSTLYHLLSSSDDGTCKIWDARYSDGTSQVYKPKPLDAVAGRSTGASSNGPSVIDGPPIHQILCCAYNANGTVFVTGSSDTHARVWIACKLNKDESGQPVHEIDVLAGHENDVNYVQFSGCAVASKSAIMDSTKDDKSSKFKNSWFCHDNIVTCSRDGSAIIWIPRSRRSHGKVRGWTRAYHLKVPPPPMPPQPPRGGPRQRLLPTPRGVNMIVWSLDNRFVLAAIMDCRICVWNAADGSLVHSLAGHNASTYVLDVHPFNPRIAMSAGYDGKTIVWDIWEGKPVKVYEIGRFKLVDGKFSPDGTSIVLSDDVGQIYLLSTGQGESQKDAKYDQFFLGDYRPLIRDSYGNAHDQETQLVPYKRNLEDLLCDSSMIPYPEPYQTMYQKRRLGALNMEWRPSSRHFAVGNDISFGPEYQLLPLADLDRMIEPLPEFLDAMYWEPENEVISDADDSEYNVTEEYCSGNERVGLGGDSSSEIECSAEDTGGEDDERDGLRRSRRNKQKAEIDLKPSYGRRVKRRMLDESAGTFSGDIKTKKSRNGSNSSKRKSSKAKSSRPQRAAARNARSMFSQFTETSTNEEEGDGSEEDTSDSESVSTEQPSLCAFEKPHKPLESQGNIRNRRLVFKLSIPESKKQPLENTSQPEEISYEKRTSLRSDVPGSSMVDHIESGPCQNLIRSPQRFVDHMDICKGDKEVKEASIHTPKGASAESHADNSFNKSTNEQVSPEGNEGFGVNIITQSCGEEKLGTRAQGDLDSVGKTEHIINPSSKFVAYRPRELEMAPPPKATKFRFKLKNLPKNPTSPKQEIMKLEDQDGFDGCVEKNTSYVGNYNHDIGRIDLLESSTEVRKTRSMGMKATGSDLLESSTDPVRTTRSMGMRAMGTDLPESSTNAVRTTRSMGLRATLHQESIDNIDFKVRECRDMAGTSCNAESILMGAVDEDLFEELVSNSKVPRVRSARSTGSMHHPSSTDRKKSNHPVRKLSWLMLTEHEESYRYIPQSGDTVVYLKQGHEEYMSANHEVLKSPWTLVKNAVEIFSVERLTYAYHPGSGESCCKIKLKCTNPSSGVFGKQFDLTLPESVNFPDFVVEKTRYDDSISRSWSPGEKCQVWWRNDSVDEEGGKWWEGSIVFSDAKSPDFPDSPWERYEIQYEDESTGSTYKHSPWELHDPNDPWLHPHIESEIAEKLLSLFARLEQSDNYGIKTLNQAAEKLDYLNRFPAPLYPEVIKLRIESNYYRSIKAVEHDMKIMLSNAESYYPKHPELLAKFRRASERIRKTLSKLNVDL